MLLPPTPDIPVLDMLDMLVMLDSDTPVLLDLDTDMLDTMASVKLMLIPLVRLVLDSPSIMPTLPDMATMLDLSPDTDLMLLPPTPGMLVLDMLVMLDILAMLVWDTLVLAILVPTMVKLGRHWYADDWIFPHIFIVTTNKYISALKT